MLAPRQNLIETEIGFFQLKVFQDSVFTENGGRKKDEVFIEEAQKKLSKSRCKKMNSEKYKMEHPRYCTGAPYFDFSSDDYMDVIRSVVLHDF